MSLQNYEVVMMTDIALTDEENQKLLEKYKEIIAKQNGKVVDECPWGRRKLAYEVKKKTHAIYHILYMEANGEIIETFSKLLGYDENVLKYFIIGIDDIQKAKDEFEALKANPTKNSELLTETVGA
ncbi:MAG: 30S ribosomal protein S6 [Deltaproteobacteria bacterium]|nr:30S ribosomal protein S6 [Deltaproteobacteria bacterium]